MGKDSDLALQAWVSANLEITQKDLSLEQARRWQRLRMRDFGRFCNAAIFGFVVRRRRDGQPDAWPEGEFGDFIGEFCSKLDATIQRRNLSLSLGMFDRVGRRTLLLALHGGSDSTANPHQTGGK